MPRRAALLSAPLRWPRPSRLRIGLGSLRGVGPATVSAAAEDLGLARLEDLLLHLPRDFTQPPPPREVGELIEGEAATIEVKLHTVGRFQARRRGRRGQGHLVVTATGRDGTPTRAIWFNQPWQAQDLRSGMWLRLSGTREPRGFVVAGHHLLGTESGNSEQDEGVMPDEADLAALPWREPDPVPAQIHTLEPVPVASASERLPARRLRQITWKALAKVEELPEPLPAWLRRRHQFPGLAEALRVAHFPALAEPDSAEAVEQGLAAAAAARRRLAYEELLMHQLVLRQRRQNRRQGHSAIALGAPGELFERWRRQLPFAFTGEQAAAVSAIAADLESDLPMQRLLMGEVGSGKTVVALAAMLLAAASGAQAALMVPTEVLAEQHLATVEQLLGDEPELKVGLLTGSTTTAGRRRLLAELAAGQIAILIGTHALIEPEVDFWRLVLCVIDEQHRFGVRQRAALDSKSPTGKLPHLLHMSATPIPRTLALAGHGDLDLTELRELPKGRRPVETRLVAADTRAAEFEALRERLRAGQQAYVICPLVSESEALQAKAALAEAERLRDGELAGFTLGVLHGRMAAAEKQRAMADFAAGQVDVLVATTVVEVGVDVPNASTIVIEGAERFGLAQLHQLRGRVGRGSHRSHCLLIANEIGPRAARRLAALERETDGFRLAELDLKLRGRGEILGTRQHGLPGFKAASLPADADLLGLAHREAGEVTEATPGALPGRDLLIKLAEMRFGGDPAGTITA